MKILPLALLGLAACTCPLDVKQMDEAGYREIRTEAYEAGCLENTRLSKENCRALAQEFAKGS